MRDDPSIEGNLYGISIWFSMLFSLSINFRQIPVKLIHFAWQSLIFFLLLPKAELELWVHSPSRFQANMLTNSSTSLKKRLESSPKKWTKYISWKPIVGEKYFFKRRPHMAALAGQPEAKCSYIDHPSFMFLSKTKISQSAQHFTSRLWDQP